MFRSEVVHRIVDTFPKKASASFHRQRNLLTALEPEDAALTGMTRSLSRRLLALNLQPATLRKAPVIEAA